MLPNARPNPQSPEPPSEFWLLGVDADVPPNRDRRADQAAKANLFAALRARGLDPKSGPGLSHSGGFAAYAESPAGGRVGVDLEWVRERDVLSLAEFAYSPEEHEWLQSLAPATQQTAFVELWVLKEAAGKALGLDLFEALRECRFAFNAKSVTPYIQDDKSWTASVFAPRPLLRLAVLVEHCGKHDDVKPVFCEIISRNRITRCNLRIHHPFTSGTHLRKGGKK